MGFARLALMFGLIGGLVACDAKAVFEKAATTFKAESPQLGAAKRSLLSQLKDPSSAQLENVQEYPEGVVCGYVNAKNSMGGYVGFTPFVYRPIMIVSGVSQAYLNPSAADIATWCNNSPNKELAELEKEYAQELAACDKNKGRATGENMGQAYADALNKAIAAFEKVSCASADEAKKKVDAHRAGKS